MWKLFRRFYNCTGDDDLAERLREADCVRSDVDGKYCAESFFDGITNGDLRACDEDDDVCEDYMPRSSRFA